MSDTRPPLPRRRLEATVTVGADSLADLAVHLMALATEVLCEHGVPESVDRFTLTDGATGRCVVSVDPDVTADSYQEALREWARETLRTHWRADHRAAALDPLEPT